MVRASAATLTVLGLVLAVEASDPEWVERAGNVIALFAAAFAFYAPCKLEDVDTWLSKSQEAVDADSQIAWDRYGEDSGVKAAERPSPISNSFHVYLAGLADVRPPTATASQLDFWNVIGGVRQSLSARTQLLEGINASLHNTEFRVVVYGLLLNTFGGMVIRPLIEPALSVLGRVLGLI